MVMNWFDTNITFVAAYTFLMMVTSVFKFMDCIKLRGPECCLVCCMVGSGRKREFLPNLSDGMHAYCSI
jgi:hypothetical protein